MKTRRALLALMVVLTALVDWPVRVEARPSRAIKVLLYPGQVRRESLRLDQARSFTVPKALRFRVSALEISGGQLALKGSLTNPTARPLRVVVFPVSAAFPFYLDLAPDPRLRFAPPKGPQPPPRPPGPVAFRVPARTRIVFRHAVDLREYRPYVGRPKVTLRWQFHYWNGPKPKGSLRVTLPPHPGHATRQGHTPGSTSSLPPYPAKWITKARLDHRFPCGRLVYKRGCSQLRRGAMVFRVTLKPSGAVASLKRLSTTIRVDPGLVARCIVKSVRRWKFHPPTNVAPTFTMRFVLADKC